MTPRRIYVLVFVTAVAVGAITESVSGARPSNPTLVLGNLTLSDGKSNARLVWQVTEEGPGMWIESPRGTVQAGVHKNGFPFLLVSDAAIRTFGLGRVDGKNASAILVFRAADVVRMVLGLSMTDAGQPPMFVRYAADGKKHEIFGRYCDHPSRVCAR